MATSPSSAVAAAAAHAAAAAADNDSTSSSNNTNDLHFPPPVFEGSEKRLEIDFYAPDPASAPARGLRAIPRAELDALLADVSSPPLSLARALAPAALPLLLAPPLFPLLLFPSVSLFSRLPSLRPPSLSFTPGLVLRRLRHLQRPH